MLWFKAAAAQLTLGVNVSSDGDCDVSFTQLVGYGLRLRFNRVPWLISVLSYSHTHTQKRHTHTQMLWLVNFSIIARLLSDIFICLHLLRMSLCAFNLDFCVNKIRTHTRQTRHTHTHTHTHVHAAYSRLCVLKQKSFRRCVRFSFVSLHARVVEYVCVCVCVVYSFVCV